VGYWHVSLANSALVALQYVLKLDPRAAITIGNCTRDPH
jgi:hypothetical protein